MKKYFYSFLRYFLLYSLGFIVFFVFSFLLKHVNEFFAIIFPGVFKIYNPVMNHDELQSQNETIALISAVLSVFTVTYISQRQDNSRYELLISQTDGLYRLREGKDIYFSEYLGADIFSALTVPIFSLGLTLINIPNDAPKILRIIDGYLGYFLAVPSAFTEKFGFIFGALLLLSASVISRFPAAYISLLRWRASWLSNID